MKPILLLALLALTSAEQLAIRPVDVQHLYPLGGVRFGIDFNETETHQANYVWYIIPNPCSMSKPPCHETCHKSRGDWQPDPYGLPTLTKDNISQPYDRAHLVPFAIIAITQWYYLTWYLC